MIKPVDRIELLRQINITGKIFVEVGVWKGDFSESILNMGPVKLILVDAWCSQQPDVYADLCNLNNTEYEKVYQSVATRFGDRPEVQIIRDWSAAAAFQMADNSIDFVYIDANHSEKACTADIESWYRVVKPGGWLLGHDYGYSRMRRVGVQAAVTKYLANHGLILDALTQERRYPSWGFIKPTASPVPTV